MKNILEWGIGIGAAAILAWTVYDTNNTKKDIYAQSRNENRSIGEICKEKGRSDVIDYLIFQEILTNTNRPLIYVPKPIFQRH